MTNFIRSLFIPKNIYSKNQTLNLSHKLPDKNDTIPNNTFNNNNIINEIGMNNIQQKSIDLTSVISKFCVKKEENNLKLTDFSEKIKNLNTQFYSDKENYLLTKSSLEKINDDLFTNLFKQINIYMEEIQRLNKKIISVENKDYKNTIKKLNKEIAENKEKIYKYEISIKEKEKKENKLIKELEYYKRRVIFFKNKININLISKNLDVKNIDTIKFNEMKRKKLIKKRNSEKSFNNITSRFTSKNVLNKKYTRYSSSKYNNNYSSSPIRTAKKKSNINYIEPFFKTSIDNKSETLKRNTINSIINGNNETYSNKNLIMVNVDKFRELILSKEHISNSNNNLIKINDNKFKDNVNDSFRNEKENNKNNKNNDNNNIDSDINENLNINKKTKKTSQKKNTKDHHSKNHYHNKYFSEMKLDNFHNVNTPHVNNKKTDFKIFNNTSNRRNSFKKKIIHFPSTKHIQSQSNKNIEYEDDINKNWKKKYLYSYKTNKSLKASKNISDFKKNKINLNTKYNTSTFNNSDNIRYNTFFGNSFNNYTESKTNKVDKDMEIKKRKYQQFKILNNIPVHESIYNQKNLKSSEKILNTDSYINKNKNDLNSNDITKIENKKKETITINTDNNNNKKINIDENKMNKINVNKKCLGKDNKDNNKYKEKELREVLKEINDDYENNIEMLNNQENQIKFLLNLIDLNED